MMIEEKQRSNDLSRLRDQFFSSGDARSALSERSVLVDSLVGAAWEQHLEPAYPAGMALVAVGGYGRRELFPHSDIDLLLLTERPPDSPARREAVSVFVRSLWDAGLRLSHSVHSPSECCQVHDQNIELNISLIDQRFLIGDAGVHRRLSESLPRFFQSRRQPLIEHLCRMTRSRHAKSQATIHHLEPNVKETPGGLRDLHLVGWLGRLRSAEPEAMDELEAARRFLHRLRCWLHFRSGRDNNLLGFDFQEEIAAEPFARDDSEGRGAAGWMRQYFRHARAIHLAALRWMETSEGSGGSLLRQFVDWRSRLSNAEFTVARERVYLKSPSLLAQDPELSLRLLTFVARHGLRLAADTERRLAVSLPSLAGYFRDSRPLWSALGEMLSLPHAAEALKAAHETGLLTVLFPEWSGIDCLVVRDFYHRYTVDEHTLIAIEKLNSLRGASDPAHHRFTEVFNEVDAPGLLVFALLFHDAGKHAGVESHSLESARLADRAMERIQMPVALRESVRFLIEHHLDLSSVMNSRDLDDPATARHLADRVGTLERLKHLALITYADTSAVHPTAMTPWRLDQLWRVYLLGFHELTRELEAERIHEAACDSPEKAVFLEGLPTRYLRTHTQAEIDSHFELALQARKHGVAVHLSRLSGAWRLTLITGDRSGLFASTAGALSAFGMNILRAEAFSNARGEILDTFIFSDPSRTLELNAQEIDRLRLTIERVALGKLEVRQLLESRTLPAPPAHRGRIQPRVSFDSEASSVATLVEVVAEDRPGLLHELASAFSTAGCNIEVVLIDTEAHKALDVFYVTKGAAKLSPDDQQALGEHLLAVSRG